VRRPAEIERAIELVTSAERECAEVGDHDSAAGLFNARMVLEWVMSRTSMFGDLVNSLEHIEITEQSNA